MKLLTNDQQKSDKNAKICYIKKSLKINISKIKKYPNVRDHCRYTSEYSGAAHSTCYLNKF